MSRVAEPICDAEWWLGTTIASYYADVDPECVELAIASAKCMKGLECVKHNCPKTYPSALAIATALSLPAILSFKDGSLEGQKHVSYIARERVKDVETAYSTPKSPTAADGSPIFGSLRDILNDIICKCETPDIPFFGVLGGIAPGGTGCGCAHDDDLFRAYSPWSKRRNTVSKPRGGWPPNNKPERGDGPFCEGLSKECVERLLRWASGCETATSGATVPAESKIDGRLHFDGAGSGKLEEWNAKEGTLVRISPACRGISATLDTGARVILTGFMDVNGEPTDDSSCEQVWEAKPPAPGLTPKAILAAMTAALNDPACADERAAFCEALPVTAEQVTPAARAKAKG